MYSLEIFRSLSVILFTQTVSLLYSNNCNTCMIARVSWVVIPQHAWLLILNLENPFALLCPNPYQICYKVKMNIFWRRFDICNYHSLEMLFGKVVFRNYPQILWLCHLNLPENKGMQTEWFPQDLNPGPLTLQHRDPQCQATLCRCPASVQSFRYCGMDCSAYYCLCATSIL